MDTNLVQRVGFAVVAIPLALGLVWLGGLPLALLVASVGVLGDRELYSFAERQGIRPLALPGLATAAGIPMLVWATGEFTERPRLPGFWVAVHRCALADRTVDLGLGDPWTRCQAAHGSGGHRPWSGLLCRPSGLPAGHPARGARHPVLGRGGARVPAAGGHLGLRQRGDVRRQGGWRPEAFANDQPGQDAQSAGSADSWGQSPQRCCGISWRWSRWAWRSRLARRSPSGSCSA